jgi:adenylate cyclase, class 2
MEPLEIEIKSRCDDPEALRVRAGAMGAQPIEETVEEDIYFNHPSRDFGETDEALRIRAAGGRCVLTYKGPKIGTRSKTRVEQEADVSDFNSMKRILLSLGFREFGGVRKRRETFRIGGVLLCIDRVDGLGDFAELEMKGSDRERIEGELFDLAARLGLSRFERRSYLELLYRDSWKPR